MIEFIQENPGRAIYLGFGILWIFIVAIAWVFFSEPEDNSDTYVLIAIVGAVLAPFAFALSIMFLIGRIIDKARENRIKAQANKKDL